MSEQPDLTTEQIEQIIAQVQFAENGLVPAIAQQWDTGEVLMMAWMSAESIRRRASGRLLVALARRTLAQG